VDYLRHYPKLVKAMFEGQSLPEELQDIEELPSEEE